MRKHLDTLFILIALTSILTLVSFKNIKPKLVRSIYYLKSKPYIISSDSCTIIEGKFYDYKNHKKMVKGSYYVLNSQIGLFNKACPDSEYFKLRIKKGVYQICFYSEHYRETITKKIKIRPNRTYYFKVYLNSSTIY